MNSCEDSDEEMMDMLSLLLIMRSATLFHAFVTTFFSLKPFFVLSYRHGKAFTVSASRSSSARHKENAMFFPSLTTFSKVETHKKVNKI